MTIGRYMGGIGALLWQPEHNTYLLLRRAAHRDVGAGHWECVTGRLDQGEGYEDALHREVREELGIPVQIEFMIGTSHFYRGAPVPENELIAVLYCCTTPDPDAIQVSAEHDETRWVTAQDAYALLGPDHWLTHVIRRAELLHAYLSPELRAEFRNHGFDMS